MIKHLKYENQSFNWMSRVWDAKDLSRPIYSDLTGTVC